ncbi:hypothetical protein CCY99_00395 [Helicobacter sp. 16-1353]|uniref:carbon-nitrogen hydrolase family protein n=1 Tax=Helicobacter sp. 16-1353 TaxID=2004996 RepID=UPI000DCCC87A|nr:carbon-nitrogen hydrolase family protein [Helicobacter sp. 16-1353]RAX55191.1 hypothetical protein CCY99_00395 [Helicobacter sp. 16-1353]
MKIIISQFENIKPNSKIFSKYITNSIKKHKIDMVVIGEYVSNLFFKQYNSKKDSLKDEFKAQEAYFKHLATTNNTTIVVPIIECKNNKFFKSIMIANPKKTTFYQSQKLMNMEHWNERDFFDNDLKSKEPIVFKIAGFNVSVLFGFEAHFDEFWIKLKNKNVDVVIVPTASTFNSNARWARLLQTRSFLNNCFVVRVNKIGKYIENNVIWEFYGNSFIALPNGNIGDMLGDKEGILVSELKKNMLDDARNDWGFR